MGNNWIESWLPGASAHASAVDLLFVGLLASGTLITLLLFFMLALFSVRYRAGSAAARDDRIKKSWRWEIGWTAATLVAFLALFFWGARLYVDLYEPPKDAVPIHVVAKQWMWKAQHPGGQREINELHLPVGRPVRLVLTSQDVIHSFFMPAFRIKRDVLPGTYSSLWLTPRKAGTFHLFCAEYCGTDHSRMTGRIVVMEPAAFQEWLERQGAGETLAQEGKRLFSELGCSGCHGNSTTVRAPRLEGLYGRPVPLQDGTVTTADDRYIRNSILQPRSQIAAGYEPVMPSFAGKISEGELIRIVAYIKSLAAPEEAAR